MRWMSNFFRLAYLELDDDKSIADGRNPSHQAELRRLRRMSMAPGIGRYYPVADGVADEDFINAEEARELLEIWRSRHPPEAEDPYDDEAWNETDQDEELDEEELDDDGLDDDYEDDESDKADEYEYAAAETSARSFPIARLPAPSKAVGSTVEGRSHLRIRDPLRHTPRREFWTDEAEAENAEAEPSLLDRIASLATDTALGLLIALVVIAAAWFVKSSLQPNAPNTTPSEVPATKKIVPSAVPRDLVGCRPPARSAGGDGELWRTGFS
jgi:hypothetical protein